MADDYVQGPAIPSGEAQRTALAGAIHVQAELARRGYGSNLHQLRLGSYRVRVQNSMGDALTIRPMTLSSGGSWQPRIDYTGEDDTLVVLLDIREGLDYYVVPAPWLAGLIKKNHAEFLEKHGGQRPVTPDSKHTAVTPAHVAEWRAAWHLLES